MWIYIHHLWAYHQPMSAPSWSDNSIGRAMHWRCRDQGSSPVGAEQNKKWGAGKKIGHSIFINCTTMIWIYGARI